MELRDCKKCRHLERLLFSPVVKGGTRLACWATPDAGNVNRKGGLKKQGPETVKTKIETVSPARWTEREERKKGILGGRQHRKRREERQNWPRKKRARSSPPPSIDPADNTEKGGD